MLQFCLIEFFKIQEVDNNSLNNSQTKVLKELEIILMLLKNRRLSIVN